MNSVQLIGRLTHDPQADQTSDWTPVATFRLAVPRVGVSSAHFVTVKVWKRLAETVARYLVRGRRVAVQGRLFHEEWSDSGDTRAERVIVLATRVDFLDPPDRAGPVTGASADGRDGVDRPTAGAAHG